MAAPDRTGSRRARSPAAITDADYLATFFNRKPNDIHVYDMVLNTSLLGEELAAPT